jgi:hypothetical protein
LRASIVATINDRERFSAPRSDLDGVKRLVDELVGAEVLLARDVADAPLAELSQLVDHLRAQRAQVLLLHLPLAAHLVGDQGGVADQLGLVGAELAGQRNAQQQRAVFGDVVGRIPDRLAALGQRLAGLVIGDSGDRGGPGVSPRAAINVDRDLYALTSSSERASAITFCARCEGISSWWANSIV